MAQLFETFNLSDLPESDGGDFSPIPAGWYTAQINSVELRDTKAGDGAFLAVRWDVTGPSHQGRVVFANLNIKNKSEKAEEIGRRQLGDIMRAGSLTSCSDTDELCGVNCEIKVTISKSEEYGERNEIKAYRSAGDVAPAAAPSNGEPAKKAKAKDAAPWA